MQPNRIALIVWCAAVTLGVHSCFSDEPQRRAGNKEGPINEFRVTSPAFTDAGPIPARFTADGANINPELHITGVPEGTESLALIMDDPDAPHGTWVHWVLWDISPETTVIAEGSEPQASVSGRNGWGRTGYGGPSPPSGTHRYFFKLYALDDVIGLPRGGDAAELERAMAGHILGEAQLMGTYTRN